MASVSHDNPHAARLVERLQAASDALIALVEGIDPWLWTKLPQPGVWSPSKDAEHVADGAAYHQWIVDQTLGQNVLARPRIERKLVIARLPGRRWSTCSASALRRAQIWCAVFPTSSWTARFARRAPERRDLAR